MPKFQQAYRAIVRLLEHERDWFSDIINFSNSDPNEITYDDSKLKHSNSSISNSNLKLNLDSNFSLVMVEVLLGILQPQLGRWLLFYCDTAIHANSLLHDTPISNKTDQSTTITLVDGVCSILESGAEFTNQLCEMTSLKSGMPCYLL